MNTAVRLTAAVLLAGTMASPVLAQSSQSTQATSPGQSGASNTLPQAPSGGTANRTGTNAGQPTEGERKADQQAKKATEICKGC